MIKFPDIGPFPWWYLAKRSVFLNSLWLVLAEHFNTTIVSPLIAQKRDELTINALAAANEFFEGCFLALTDPGKIGGETRYDLFLVSSVLYLHQKELEIQLNEKDEGGFKKELERLHQLLKKIISYNPDESQPLDEEDVLRLFKFFNALANYINLQSSAYASLAMARG